jgi:integrase
MREAWLAWEETRKAAGKGDSRYAVCSLDGSSLHKSTLSHDMCVAYKRAGFPKGQRTHALRYTACIRLFEAGFSFADIAEHTGHRMASMAAEYCRKRRNAVERGIAIEAFEGIQRKALSDALERTGVDAAQAEVATAAHASPKRRRLH